MPLSSSMGVGEIINELRTSGKKRSRAQLIAIALSVKRKKKKY